MTDQKPKAELKTLYQITGSVADINTILVNRGELTGLRADLGRERMRLTACGVVAMADTPDSAKEARIMHPDYESASCDDVKRRVDECIELHARVAELEAQLESIGAGGVGLLMPAANHPEILDSSQRLSMVLMPRSVMERVPEALEDTGCNSDLIEAIRVALVQHQHESSGDNKLQSKNGQLSTSSSIPNSRLLMSMPVPIGPPPEHRKAGQVAYPLGKLMDDEIARVKAEQEPVAWIVWWGIGEMRPHERLFKTKAEAEAFAREIKSNTEIHPVNRLVSPSQDVQEQWGRCLVAVQTIEQISAELGKVIDQRDKLLALLRIVRGKHGCGALTLPRADVERIDAAISQVGGAA